MSMSTHVVAFRPPDEKWKLMKAVYDACFAAGIDPPSEVWVFFEHEPPDDKGVEIDITGALEAWHDDWGSEGYELAVDQIPADVTTIRFYNNY